MLLSCRGQGDTITKRRNHRLLGRNQRLIERSEDMTEIEARSMDPKRINGVGNSNTWYYYKQRWKYHGGSCSHQYRWGRDIYRDRRGGKEYTRGPGWVPFEHTLTLHKTREISTMKEQHTSRLLLAPYWTRSAKDISWMEFSLIF